jgi:hypothetical protein
MRSPASLPSTSPTTHHANSTFPHARSRLFSMPSRTLPTHPPSTPSSLLSSIPSAGNHTPTSSVGQSATATALASSLHAALVSSPSLPASSPTSSSHSHLLVAAGAFFHSSAGSLALLLSSPPGRECALSSTACTTVTCVPGSCLPTRPTKFLSPTRRQLHTTRWSARAATPSKMSPGSPSTRNAISSVASSIARSGSRSLRCAKFKTQSSSRVCWARSFYPASSSASSAPSRTVTSSEHLIVPVCPLAWMFHKSTDETSLLSISCFM